MQHLDDAGQDGSGQDGRPAGADSEWGRRVAFVREALGRRSIVLVGMMGAGKTSVGRRLSHALDLPFVDADAEIEVAAGGMTIPEIFATKGEPYFREREARVIARLLEDGAKVLATGGGAWMNPETRGKIGVSGVSIWLRAEVDVLLRRVRKRGNRPLLATADPEGALRALVETRYPVYALADVTVSSREGPHEHVVTELIDVLFERFSAERTVENDA